MTDASLLPAIRRALLVLFLVAFGLGAALGITAWRGLRYVRR